MEMDINLLVTFAIEVLASLDAEVYANLSYFRAKTTLFDHLEAILRMFEGREKPAVTIEGKPYFIFSQAYIRRWAKEELDSGGTGERWQSHKIVLLDLGLVEKYVVTGPSDIPALNRIWNAATRKNRRPETLWTIPLYDTECLMRAEHIAGIYRNCRVSIAHLRKNTVIRFRGQAQADFLYWPDRRRIGEAEATVLSSCREAIRTAIRDKGYTTFKELKTRVRADLAGRPVFQQMLLQLLSPDKTERKDSYNALLGLILQEKNLLCLEVGCVYRQIRKEDRETLNLPETLRSWFIVPRQRTEDSELDNA